MKKVACLLLVGALGLFGCGGGGDDDDISFDDAGAADADPNQVDADPNACPDTVVCNAVAQTGCAVGEKCAVILDDPDTGASHIGCIADGTQAVGASCTDSAVACASDDCSAGGECYNGLCHEICTTALNNCTDTGVCVQFVDSNGNDLPTQICLFGCDPLDQTSCDADNEACYLINDGGACVVPSGGTGLPIGDDCMFANACVPGGICIGSADASVCRLMCGNVVDMWTEVDGSLTTPNCCGSAGGGCAAATINCLLSDQFCGLIGDGAGGLASEVVGFCATDEYHSSDDGTSFVCTCGNDPICVSSASGFAPTSSEPSVPIWRVR